MYYLPSSAVGQQLVTATVHLAGPVETETGHVANAGGAHITARLGGLLLYFLDRDAVGSFVQPVATVRKLVAVALNEYTAPALPGNRDIVEQSIGLVIRLSGAQDVGQTTTATTAASRDGGPFVALRLGGLRVVVRIGSRCRNSRWSPRPLSAPLCSYGSTPRPLTLMLTTGGSPG